jgi:LPPG:FO 2-phospho-L-lactate transferase
VRVLGLGGGIGASRLWTALAAALDPGELTLIVNTGDDLWQHGLRICPDLDTTLYTLSGRRDEERGWGVRGESWRCMDALRTLDGQVWFDLGDVDLATHLLRTGLLRDGVGLAAVTARLAGAMGVGVRVLPMTEDEVVTRVEVAGGRILHYEEFLVRHGALPAVRRLVLDGTGAARPAPGVLEAIAEADLIVLAPSNPLASIAPILAVPQLRAALRRAAAERVAVTPIVSGVPITDPDEARRAASRAALLASLDLPATAAAVAGLYRDLVHRFVLDVADADQVDAVAGLGVEPVVVATLLHRGAPAADLVAALLLRTGSEPCGRTCVCRRESCSGRTGSRS